LDAIRYLRGTEESWETHEALEQVVFLKMCGTCMSNFQDVKLFSSLDSCPVLYILLVLSSLDSQTALPLVLSSLTALPR
jgi:hypothetical protein